MNNMSFRETEAAAILVLEKTIPNTRNNLKIYYKALELVREPLLELRLNRYSELCKKREQYRHPKDKDYTDFDRRTMLEAAVADVQADYELARGLETLVAERVELIKILLKDS